MEKYQHKMEKLELLDRTGNDLERKLEQKQDEPKKEFSPVYESLTRQCSPYGPNR